MTKCQLEVTAEHWDEIRGSEAVTIVEYERNDGTRFGHVLVSGSFDECRDEADRHEIVVMLIGSARIIGKTAVRVADLLPPEKPPEVNATDRVGIEQTFEG